MLRLLTSFALAPFILLYGFLLAFFVLNGVSGSDVWIKKWWARFGGVMGAILMGLGFVCWVGGVVWYFTRG